MATKIGDLIAGLVDRLVRWVVLPITGAIPVLIQSGILLVGFGVLWIAFAAALMTNPAALNESWRTLGQLPLPIQAIAWLLLMPPLAGLWVWQAEWPFVVRCVLIAGIAGWNLLVLVPRRGQPRAAPAGPQAASR